MNIATLLSFITTISIFAGVVFAILQLRYFNRQRSTESAMQLLHSFQTAEFMEAVGMTFDMPDGLSKKEVEEKAGNKMTSILVMFGTFESLGILVFRRELDIELVDDFFSGPIVLCWRKYKKYLEEVRLISNRPTYAEWVQWLAEQFEKRESGGPVIPAQIAHKNWKP